MSHEQFHASERGSQSTAWRLYELTGPLRFRRQIAAVGWKSLRSRRSRSRRGCSAFHLGPTGEGLTRPNLNKSQGHHPERGRVIPHGEPEYER